MSAREQLAADLTDDGTVCELEDGRTFRLRIEADQDIDINDDEFHGKIGWSTRDRDTGREVRPDGFDGNAEKISLMHDVVWWQPPEGLTIERGTREWSAYRSFVADLATFGYKGVVLEQLEGSDAYGRPVVVAVASLWGIDSLENGYLAEVVGELYNKLVSQ